MIAINKNSGQSRSKKILVEQSFAQSDKGKKKNIAEYTGTIRIGMVLIRYEITVLQLFNWRDRDDLKKIMILLFGSEKGIKHLRSHCFRIIVRRRKKEVKLTTREYVFFASLIIPYAYNIFGQGEIKSPTGFKEEISQKGILYHGKQSITSLSYITITNEEIELLASFKFGCRFD